MSTTVASTLWLFARRHAVAFASAVSWLFAIAIGLRFWPYDTVTTGMAVLFATIPIVHLAYSLAIFSFGSNSDLLSSTSTYPPHLLRLPLSSLALTAYSFGLGAVFLAIYWSTTCFGVLLPLAELRKQDWFGPSFIMTPLVWLSTLALVQSVLWSNHRSIVIRTISLVAALTLPILLASRWWTPNVSDAWVIGGLLISIPVGLAMAVANLNLARQGVSGGWFSHRFLPDETKRHSANVKKPTEQSGHAAAWRQGIQTFLFRHPVRAQAWYDWRRYCLPIAISTGCAMLLFASLGILWPSAREARVTILFLPPTIGCFVGFGIGGMHVRTSESSVSSFFASLPLTTTQFISAKWMAAFVCATFICLTAIILFVATTLIAGDSLLIDAWQWLRQEYPAAQLFFGAIAGPVIYTLLTWVLLIQAIPIKLSGRHWLNGFCIVALAAVFVTMVVSLSIQNANILPWTLALAIVVKISAAVWTLRTLRCTALIDSSELVNLTQFWFLLVVLSITTVSGFLLPFKPALILPLAIAAFLLAPLSRLASAPLALHWNRHR